MVDFRLCPECLLYCTYILYTNNMYLAVTKSLLVCANDSRSHTQIQHNIVLFTVDVIWPGLWTLHAPFERPTVHTFYDLRDETQSIAPNIFYMHITLHQPHSRPLEGFFVVSFLVRMVYKRTQLRMCSRFAPENICKNCVADINMGSYTIWYCL